MYGIPASRAIAAMLRASLCACSSDSMTHGPAIKNSSPPPTVTFRTLNPLLTPPSGQGSSSFYLHDRGKHFFHRLIRAATGSRLKLAPAVRPHRVRNATKRYQSLIVSLLIAVVDSVAGKHAVAIVLIR